MQTQHTHTLMRIHAKKIEKSCPRARSATPPKLLMLLKYLALGYKQWQSLCSGGTQHAASSICVCVCVCDCAVCICVVFTKCQLSSSQDIFFSPSTPRSTVLTQHTPWYRHLACCFVYLLTFYFLCVFIFQFYSLRGHLWHFFCVFKNWQYFRL